MRVRLRIACRLALKLILAVALAAGLTGCWSKQELNDRTFVSTLIVDLTEEGETEISTMFMLPNRISVGLNAAPGNEKPYVLVSGKGRDTSEAFQQIQKDLPRSVAWGQMRAVIVGDRYARAGMAPLLDFLIRATDFRLRIYMFYFDGEARSLAKLTPLFERFPTEVWRESAHSRHVPPVSIRDLLYAQWNNLGDAYIPELTLRELRLLTEDKPVEWSGVGGAALVRNNAVIGKFTENEMVGITLMKNGTPEMIVTAQLPDGGMFSARLTGVGQRTRAARRGGKVFIQVSIRAQADLVALQSKINMSDPASLKTIERALNARIREMAQAAADRAQEERADVFQWSEFVKYKYPSLWAGWTDELRENLFLRMKPDIRANVTLRSTGVNRSSRASASGGERAP